MIVRMDILEDLWKTERKAQAMLNAADIKILSKAEKIEKKERRKWEEPPSGRYTDLPVF